MLSNLHCLQKYLGEKTKRVSGLMQAVLALRSLCSSSLQLILGAITQQQVLFLPGDIEQTCSCLCTSASGVTNAKCFKALCGK